MPLLYEFREYCSNCKLIIASGYGFQDNHINKIIKQALQADKNRKILVNHFVPPVKEGESAISIETHILDAKERYKKSLEIDDINQIEIVIGSTKQFFNESLSIEKFNTLFPEPHLPFDDIDTSLGEALGSDIKQPPSSAPNP